MKLIKTVIAVAAMALGAQAVAQTYPARSIAVIANVTGGAPEAMERAIFDKVRENTGANLLFEEIGRAHV